MPGCYGQALFCRQNAKKVLLLCVAAGLFEIFVNLWKSILGRVGGKVLFDHQRYLKDDGVIEVAQIQAGQLADLLQAVDQRVAVYEQAAARFGNVQVVLEEALDGEQSLLIQTFNAALLEDRKSTRLNSSHRSLSRMPSSA